jgi:hypothetical protein
VNDVNNVTDVTDESGLRFVTTDFLVVIGNRRAALVLQGVNCEGIVVVPRPSNIPHAAFVRIPWLRFFPTQYCFLTSFIISWLVWLSPLSLGNPPVDPGRMPNGRCVAWYLAHLREVYRGQEGQLVGQHSVDQSTTTLSLSPCPLLHSRELQQRDLMIVLWWFVCTCVRKAGVCCLLKFVCIGWDEMKRRTKPHIVLMSQRV